MPETASSERGDPAQSAASAARAPQIIAAVDLGSNSFHMVVARFEDGRITIIDRLREMVRLGGGVNSDLRIEASAAERAIACLGRFGERLRVMRAESVRAVGTNTLRRVRDDEAFLGQAERALGHPIEIISGIEEARLVYLGAAHTAPLEPGRRLVVDIGGGSTELAVGTGLTAEKLESLYIGCIGLSEAHFPGGRLSAAGFASARMAVRLELEPVAADFRALGWAHAAGTSGTVRATADVLRALGHADGVITAPRLAEIAGRMAQSGHVERLALPGLTADRAPVYAGGLAILQEVFARLGIDALKASDGALREGLLFDLLGRLTDEDARVCSVRALARRYRVDAGQAARVAATASMLHDRLAAPWALVRPLNARILRWAAELHELGLDISHAKHHRHAGYLLENADLPGFSRQEQALLACLVGSHRRKLAPAPFAGLPAAWQPKARYLLVILRLAVLLHRGRSTVSSPAIGLEPGPASLRLAFPPGWLDGHPLTRLDLEHEAGFLAAIGFRLVAA